MLPLLGIAEEYEDLVANERDHPRKHRYTEPHADAKHPNAHAVGDPFKDFVLVLGAIPLYAKEELPPIQRTS